MAEHRESFTVKVPPQWSEVTSARAREWLRNYFVHPVDLPPDPGAGDRVLRLALDDRMVAALSRGSGEVPAVALRRLLAARVRELPPASSGDSGLKVEGPRVLPGPSRPVAERSGGPPSFWEPQAEREWRVAAWASLSPEYRAQVLGVRSPSLNVLPARNLAQRAVSKPSVAEFGSLLRDCFWYCVMPFLVIALVYWIISKIAGVSSPGVSSPSRFGEWRPE